MFWPLVADREGHPIVCTDRHGSAPGTLDPCWLLRRRFCDRGRDPCPGQRPVPTERYSGCSSPEVASRRTNIALPTASILTMPVPEDQDQSRGRRCVAGYRLPAPSRRRPPAGRIRVIGSTRPVRESRPGPSRPWWDPDFPWLDFGALQRGAWCALPKRTPSPQKSYLILNIANLPSSGAPTNSRCRLFSRLYTVSSRRALGWKGSW